MGYMSETHMLKSYKQRVESTYALMETMLDFLDEKGEELVSLREETKATICNQEEFEISWSPVTGAFKYLLEIENGHNPYLSDVGT